MPWSLVGLPVAIGAQLTAVRFYRRVEEGVTEEERLPTVRRDAAA